MAWRKNFAHCTDSIQRCPRVGGGRQTAAVTRADVGNISSRVTFTYAASKRRSEETDINRLIGPITIGALRQAIGSVGQTLVPRAKEKLSTQNGGK